MLTGPTSEGRARTPAGRSTVLNLLYSLMSPASALADSAQGPACGIVVEGAPPDPIRPMTLQRHPRRRHQSEEGRTSCMNRLTSFSGICAIGNASKTQRCQAGGATLTKCGLPIVQSDRTMVAQRGQAVRPVPGNQPYRERVHQCSSRRQDSRRRMSR